MGRTHLFQLDAIYPQLVFYTDDEIALWSDGSRDVSVWARNGDAEDVFVFPSGVSRRPGSGRIQVFQTDSALVRADPSSSSGSAYQIASVDGVRELPNIRSELRRTNGAEWCGFAERAMHRFDARTGALRSEEVGELLHGGQAGGDCLALTRDSAGAVFVRVLSAEGLESTLLPGVVEVEGAFSSAPLRESTVHRELGLVAVEGRLAMIEGGADGLDVGRGISEVALDPSTGSLLVLESRLYLSPGETSRLFRVPEDSPAVLVEAFERSMSPNPCQTLATWPYIEQPASGTVLEGRVVRCEALGEGRSRLVVVDTLTGDTTVLGDRELTLSVPVRGTDGLTVWKEPSRVLVLDVGEDGQVVLEALAIPGAAAN
jgi:hypothetical protein